ncbi:hypothetical protein DICPUDRAFT_96028 [Dictyostelium purpureum]|uniref:Protein phosphatase inhibitor 2 n=1 Tax=Dictyostelium purpureum TaxID=5786 RepID=F1A3Y6_DICPU|nr:uncharacterized protein DICPUDRAFT_96028 [Dictyostelium purpureum]EGC29092.1 hypothetical protein DICPUDRAFT_96028 [Dictyostelium purpureum]|eukprot:XP_003294380.1 hypothetical protein DICPUDRAFT_96028 [Dictyostelium purpureum]
MNKDEEFIDSEEHHYEEDDKIENDIDQDLDYDIYKVDGEDDSNDELDEDMYKIDGEDDSSSSEDEKQKFNYYSKKKRNLSKSLSPSSSKEFKIIPYKTLQENTPTKGILKNKNEKPPPKKNRIAWDEENLNFNDMNKSATMKIDEPKTPYHYYESEEESDESKKYLENKFLELKNALDKQQEKSEWDSDDEDNEEELNIKRKKKTNNKKINKKEKVGFGGGGSSNDYEEEEDEKEDEEKKENRKKFDSLRKAHYNEFRAIKSLGSNLSDEDEV